MAVWLHRIEPIIKWQPSLADIVKFPFCQAWRAGGPGRCEQADRRCQTLVIVVRIGGKRADGSLDDQRRPLTPTTAAASQVGSRVAYARRLAGGGGAGFGQTERPVDQVPVRASFFATQFFLAPTPLSHDFDVFLQSYQLVSEENRN
uniref:SFRICE_000136 n=1 Tax=Spodoptera frugiperda TaxID=7108 RepID=A0A2H1W8S7_SPOFR